MSSLLDLYHPDLSPTVRSIQARLAVAQTAPARANGRWEVALLRVSDESRAKFEKNLATDLDWLTWAPEAAWVKANISWRVMCPRSSRTRRT